ncbi:MAG: D-alanyl-D-alanine carboxypeptidase/D-alanyl-D-alanine-endopeptidase [Oxalobacter sp.]|nr:MAG: D-alanyl-D-alanine carboxypeptidase/D-alanyl-D-alanine-endopeptidase [Oxalobacter sp.]
MGSGVRKMKKSVLFLLLGGCFASVWAQRLPTEVQQAMRLADIPASATAILVQEVNSRSPKLSVNVHKSFNPASTMKLITTGAALDLLGPSYTWKTQAYITGEMRGDVLRGDLIFKGSGDPKFVSENLWHFLRQIRAKGIRDIRGDILLDRGAMATKSFDASEFDGAPEKAYNAGPDALLLNFKAVKLQFSPDGTIGKARVAVDPPLEDFSIDMPALSNEECNGWQKKLELGVNSSGVGFSGTYDSTCGEQSWFVHAYWISNDQYFGAAFKQIWRDIGGSFGGEVKSGSSPASATLFAEWISPPLTDIVRDINKFSNNVMARQLLVTLGMDPQGQPATAQRGARAIQHWLAEKRIAAPELVIENGSGLSRTEKISAATMGKLLSVMWRSPRMPEFVASLPITSHDGSMRKRLNDTEVAGRGHIKTGGLRGVRTIAGYMLAASGKRYIVVHFINHPNAGEGNIVHDALLQWVYENG